MFKSSFIVMIINMLSRILGLIREMIIGSVFGATGMTDAYVSATKIPNFFTTLFGEGSLGTVFIPIYNRGMAEEGKERTDDFVFSLLNLIVAFTSTLSVIMIFFSKQILKVTTGFNDPKRFDAANNLLKIVAFYFLFIALSGVVSSLLNNYKKFAVSASMGIVFNLTIIAGTLMLKNKMGIYGLGVAYLLSGVFQLVIMLPQFFQIMKKYKFILNLKDEYVKEMFVLMVPTLVGIFGYQINEIVDNRFATSLPAGTASALNYASRLYLLPIGVFAISLAVVIFPTLSKAVVKNDKPMYINAKGDIILTPEYLYDANSDLKKITQFKEQIGNVILAYDGSKWAYYDATSYKKISENYKDATIITNGVGGATKNGGYWALLDSKANPITDEKFDSIVVDERGVPCRNDSLIVQKDLRYILVNKKGEQISDQVYEDAKGFNDTTLAAVKKGKKWIFIDPTGKEVDLGDFEEVSSFSGGLAAVKKNGKWGYIDMTGKIVIPCTFEDARLISESGIGFVKNDNGRWQLLQLIRLNHD